MKILEYVLLIFLILCAIGATISKRLLVTVIIFMAYSTVMAVIWLFLEAPDLAITEAAVGAGALATLDGDTGLVVASIGLARGG